MPTAKSKATMAYKRFSNIKQRIGRSGAKYLTDPNRYPLIYSPLNTYCITVEDVQIAFTNKEINKVSELTGLSQNYIKKHKQALTKFKETEFNLDLESGLYINYIEE